MKTILALFFSAAVAIAADAPAPLVLSTNTTNGGAITTTVTVGRVQGDPSADGTLMLTIIPHETIKLSDGTVIKDAFAQEWFTVKLTAEDFAPLFAKITAAKEAADAAKLPAK